MSTTVLTTVVLGGYILSGRCIVRLRRSRLRRALFVDILRVGAVGMVNTLQTTLTVTLTTALVGMAAGPDAIAGYGTGSRLEYLLVPLVFGLGAPLVALVGTNIGAGQRARALRVAVTGGAIAFAMTEAIGVAAALWPQIWLGLFGSDPRMLATGVAYLHAVGPAYGFFGLGLALYFASQGAGRLFWPLMAGLLRMVVAVGGGWLAVRLGASPRMGVRRARRCAGALWRGRRRRDRVRGLVPRPTREVRMLYFEDLSVGQKFTTAKRRVDAEEIVGFAAKYDPQPFHLDPEAAKASLFGGLAARRLAQRRDDDAACRRQRVSPRPAGLSAAAGSCPG